MPHFASMAVIPAKNAEPAAKSIHMSCQSLLKMSFMEYIILLLTEKPKYILTARPINSMMELSYVKRGGNMFSYEVLNSLNDLEMLVYNYVLEHKEEIKYMTIRELAEGVHVSTSTIVRFCKKLGCEGYSEFKVKFKMYLKEEKKKQPETDLNEIRNFFETFRTTQYQESMEAVAGELKKAEHLIFLGIGTSGILGKYGARYFSNLGKYSQYIEDPYYPIVGDMGKTAVIALSVSGETEQVIMMAGRFKEHKCRLISITNKGASTLGKMSDHNLNYYVSERMVEDEYNITTQVPVVFLLESLGKRLS